MKKIIIPFIALISFYGCTEGKPKFDETKPYQSIRNPDIGRYKIVFNPSARVDTFMLDTATGKAWINTCYTDKKGKCESYGWEEMVKNIKF